MTQPPVTEIDVRTQIAAQKLDALRQSFAGVGVAAERLDTVLGEQNVEFLRLAASTDVLARARLSFEAAERRAGAALDAGKINAQQFASVLDGVVAKQTTAIQRTGAFGAAMGGAAGGARSLSQVAGQAGFQIQDFAVQVQAGTSALTAFSQQAPQLLGVFGPAGAIAGAAVAFAAIGLSIANATGALDTFLGKSKELSAALEVANDYLKEQEELGKKIADPYERLAAAAASARMELAKLLDVEQARAANDLDRAVGPGGFVDPNQSGSAANPEVGRAVDVTKRAELARDVALGEEFRKEREGRDERLGKLLKEDVDQQLKDQEAARREAERSAAEATRQLDRAATEARRAADRQAADDARSAAQAAREREREEAAAAREREKSEERIRRLQEQSEADAERQRQRENDRAAAFEEWLASLEREAELAGMTKELREEELAIIEARNKAGRELDQAEEARVRAAVQARTANEEMRRSADETSRFIENSFDRALDRVGNSLTDLAVKGGDAFGSLRNVAAGVVASIYTDFMKLAAVNPIKNALFGGSAPTLFGSGGLFAGLFGGGGSSSYMGAGYVNTLSFGGPRAEGGGVDPSSWYWVGEKGKEKFVPDVPGRIVPANENRAGRVIVNDYRGAGSPDIDITESGDGDLIVTIRREIARQAPGIVEASVGAVATRMQRGKFPG